MKISDQTPPIQLCLADLRLSSPARFNEVMARLTSVQNCSTTLKLRGKLLTTASTSESGLNNPGRQQREELDATRKIPGIFFSIDTTDKPLTCGQVANALRNEYVDALATAHGIVAQGPAGLLHRSDCNWPQSVGGTVTCNIPYTPRPNGNVKPYFHFLPEEARFVRSILTIKDFSLGQAGVGKFSLSLSHITLRDINFDSDQSGSIKFPHSQITGGVINVPNATVDLTDARLEDIKFGSPMTALHPARLKLTLTGATCTGVDFSGINLFALNADRALFLNVNLSNAIIESSDFSHAHLENVCFDNTEAQDIDLRDAVLENVIWRNSDFSNALLDNTRITLDLSDQALLNDEEFHKAILTITTLHDRYETLRNELARSVKKRLTELAVDRPEVQSMILHLGVLLGV